MCRHFPSKADPIISIRRPLNLEPLRSCDLALMRARSRDWRMREGNSLNRNDIEDPFDSTRLIG
ncbi:hypothetical protein F2Q70_00010177 [Brassica cretica]|uniref:Uncharacterized protein n=1 Tax=Brassica cretica TaxID=69181 RepID=A0A8S9M073_BRACR|nr:hypothetical protein F2Q70_00010177 [Brassica cretica]